MGNGAASMAAHVDLTPFVVQSAIVDVSARLPFRLMCWVECARVGTTRNIHYVHWICVSYFI